MLMHEYSMTVPQVMDLTLDQFYAMIQYLHDKAEAEREAASGKSNKGNGRSSNAISLRGMSPEQITATIAAMKEKGKADGV